MIYLDNGATTRPFADVLLTYQTVATDFFANPSSAHPLGQQAKVLLQQARQQIADILQVKADEIFFGSSGTEMNNWVLTRLVQALAQKYPTRKRVIVSAVEHPSVREPFNYLRQQGFEVVICPVDSAGILDITEFVKLLNDDVLLVSTMAVNNEMGAVQPLEALAELLQDHSMITWHVDAVQGLTTQLETLRRLTRIDCLTISSHKFHAVKGVGILMKRERVLDVPWLLGGGQERGLRSSTENLPAIVATAKAMRLMSEQQVSHKQVLAKWEQQLRQIAQSLGWHIFGDERISGHIYCLALPSIPGEVMVTAFAEKGIYVSTTSACSSRVAKGYHTLNQMKVDPSLAQCAIRISFGYDTTAEEFAILLETMATISRQFQRVRD